MKVTTEEISSCMGDRKFFPPGFRFHPTDEELILFYLKGKICRRRQGMDVITETDVYKWDPEELPGLSKLKTGDRQWFFFSPRDRKYPNGGRSNRATRHGYWKATGKDRIIPYKSRDVGVKKTLVFYKGRAPTGERTDWVMHEYTLDEDELKRCKSAKDYYALYKVFKKSGPGPKNGEQYGAPFREEDWSDEEIDKNEVVDPENSVEAVFKAATVDKDRVNVQLQSLNYLEKNRIPDELLPLSVADYGYLFEEEAQSNLVDQSSRGIDLHEQNIDIYQPNQQYSAQASFGLTQSGTSQLHEASEVTSALNSQTPLQLVGEDLLELEDFLEMDDLVGPQPAGQNSEKSIAAVENPQFDEFDGLSELDLYKDVLLGFDGFGAAGQQGQMSLPYISNLENEVINPDSNFCLNNNVPEPISYEQPYLSNGQHETFQQWSQDQNSSVYTAAGSHQGTIPPAISGVVYDGNFSNRGSGADNNQSGQRNDGKDSWISSALWAFVESIPTTPASASESALVNRAFERMSSFGRVRINNRNMNVAARDTLATSRSSSKYKSRLFCFSLIGVMCAILWMLRGTSVGVVLGR